MRKLGAYLLPGDVVWLAKSLTQYYPLLSDLVVVVPASHRGWTGAELPVDEALAIIRSVDRRSIMRVVTGEWMNPAEPMLAETLQRQAGLDALRGSVDWVLQIDNDEFLPRIETLGPVIDEAEHRGITAIDWPMRVLYRRTSRAVFEIVSDDGQPSYEYPGPIAVRPDVTLDYARRAQGDFLRPTVHGDRESLQVNRESEAGEHRADLLTPDDAIVHNSWARSPEAMRRKLRSWGHARDSRFGAYYWLRWWPTPATWRLQRNLHPFASGLWPRLARRPLTEELTD
jgi:hypothetical protein